MIKILVVDDHAFLRDAIRSILEDESDMNVVGEASSGDGVLEKVEACRPDCILMDINHLHCRNKSRLHHACGMEIHVHAICLEGNFCPKPLIT